MNTLTQHELVAVNGGKSDIELAYELYLEQLRREAEKEEQEFHAQQTMAN